MASSPQTTSRPMATALRSKAVHYPGGSSPDNAPVRQLEAPASQADKRGEAPPVLRSGGASPFVLALSQRSYDTLTVEDQR